MFDFYRRAFAKQIEIYRDAFREIFVTLSVSHTFTRTVFRICLIWKAFWGNRNVLPRSLRKYAVKRTVQDLSLFMTMRNFCRKLFHLFNTVTATTTTITTAAFRHRFIAFIRLLPVNRAHTIVLYETSARPNKTCVLTKVRLQFQAYTKSIKFLFT